MPIWDKLSGSRIVDLSQPLHRGMPVSPNHPGFQMALMRRHGDVMRDDGSSASNEMIVTGGHVGTHIDALAHVSHNGLLYGGVEAASIQSQHGFSRLGVDEVEPIACRGVLLDVASVRETDVLAPGTEVTVADMESACEMAGVQVREGDAVLIRTGWTAHWDDPDMFGGQTQGAPGPGAKAAEWLADRQVRVTGAETIAYEVIRPGAGHSLLPAHRTLLVDSGIHIIEVMNLDDLVGHGEFGFIAIPLKILGATGSPIRPIAILDD